MKLSRKVVIAVVVILLVLPIAFIGLVDITAPAPVVPPPEGRFAVKVLSIDKSHSGYVVRLERQGETTSLPVFELEYPGKQDEHSVPPIGEVVNYSKDASLSQGYLWWECTGADHCGTVVSAVYPFDPLYWFHNEENGLGVASFCSFALLIPVALVIGILGWLAPIYIAKKRGHPNFMPITVITILFGWTFIGWAVCLAWSLSHVKVQDSIPEVVTK